MTVQWAGRSRQTHVTAFGESATGKKLPHRCRSAAQGGQDSISAQSTEAQSGGRDRFDGGHDAHAGAGLVELDGAVGESEQGPIAAGADVGTGGELGTALADQDASRGDKLGAECLDAETLADAVAPVA